MLACDTAWRFSDERRASSSACGPEEAQHLRNLVGDALERLVGRGQARLQGLAGGLSTAARDLSPGAGGLLAYVGRFIGHGASRAGGLAGRISGSIRGLIGLIVRVVACSHLNPLR